MIQRIHFSGVMLLFMLCFSVSARAGLFDLFFPTKTKSSAADNRVAENEATIDAAEISLALDDENQSGVVVYVKDSPFVTVKYDRGPHGLGGLRPSVDIENNQVFARLTEILWFAKLTKQNISIGDRGSFRLADESVKTYVVENREDIHLKITNGPADSAPGILVSVGDQPAIIIRPQTYYEEVTGRRMTFVTNSAVYGEALQYYQSRLNIAREARRPIMLTSDGRLKVDGGCEAVSTDLAVASL
jgi:hypothetical protein